MRCWYLFQNLRIGRAIVLFAYIGCGIATWVLIGLVWHELRPLQLALPIAWDGCMAPQSPHAYRVFIPGIVVHTILYAATSFPALRLKNKGKTSPIMNRLLRDGGVMYFVVFVSIMFSGIGATSTNLNVSLPAMYSNFFLASTSVAVSRLILNMQSLASNLSLDPKWLLNNAELSRVRWRKGSRDGEIIVEVDVAEVDSDGSGSGALSSPDSDVELGAMAKGGMRIPKLTTTTYGYEDDVPNLFYMGKGDTRP
ncbi:hypothetical protein EUX98_g7356 [Antrodiella citrinella]|uniref:Uncharacterized protein n=1 Tax=Antrodiella citrinella TaxID=2447956 RepID=A0A4S4MP52_9APHY|nr:hypothetical protein EUX98_g7356 [Antrodiella citrinella]